MQPQGDAVETPCARLSLERACALAGVSRAGYYRHWQAHAPRQEEVDLRHRAQQLALENRHYGHRRIGALLRREGRPVGRHRLLRLLREDNLLCLRRKAFVPATTDSRHGWRVVPNLARGMQVTSPNQLWVADLTYVRLDEEFAYVAAVLDAYSRKVVGWALDTHLRASLALAALDMALAGRDVPPGLVHHSDRGVQYACGEYVACLEAHGLQASMSRIGNPYDNAKAESFMKTLKAAEVDGRAYRDVDDARRQIGRFIEDVYNRRRLHSALGYQSPVEFEASLPSAATVAGRPAPAVAGATCP